MESLRIRKDDLRGSAIARLLAQHLDEMALHSPPESTHALDLEGLRSDSIAFWSAWVDEHLVGCIALKRLDDDHGEIKSMRTDFEYRGRGIGGRLLAHLIDAARATGLGRLSLETGSQPAFGAARRLYEAAGFRYCPPFADYVDDPNSVFMTLDLSLHLQT